MPDAILPGMDVAAPTSSDRLAVWLRLVSECHLQVWHYSNASVRGRCHGMYSIRHHYDSVLGPHYTWMVGGFDTKVSELVAELEAAQLPRVRGGLAVDLGCGPGFHSVALAERGYRVVAVDASERLLRELHDRVSDQPIEVVRGDLRDLHRYLPDDASVDLALVLGDTITHLDSSEEVETLAADVANRMSPGGELWISYRDLSVRREGLDRFLLTRSEPDRIVTTFLEDDGDKVIVHDLVHVRCHGDWRLRKGSYSKLRIASGWLQRTLEDQGFDVVQIRGAGNMTQIRARRR